MPTINVANERIDVDIRTELEAFEWQNARWTEQKLIAASPFRSDFHPSFFVNLETGGWHDSGAYDSEWQNGNFAKLIAFLRDETYEEACDYLLATYAPFHSGSETQELRMPTLRLRKQKERVVLAENRLVRGVKSSYLSNRGITEQVQRYLEVGYSERQRAVVLPWRHPNGQLANMKFRKVDSKIFWYASGGNPVSELLYASHIVFKRELPEVVICEAEIDALTWMSVGKPAVAVGGASLSPRQLELLRKSPVERALICTDNDGAGEKLREQLAEGLSGYMRVGDVRVPAPYKDANEAHVAGVELAELAESGVEWRSGLRLGRAMSENGERKYLTGNVRFLYNGMYTDNSR